MVAYVCNNLYISIMRIPKFSLPFFACLSFLVLSVGFVSVSALAIDPTSIVLKEGETGKVNVIVQSPPAGVNGVSLQLQLKNLTVTDLNEGPNVLSIGICDGGAKYLEDRVCVDLAATSDFYNGQVLATLSVLKKGTEEGAITIVDGTEYSDGSPIGGANLLQVLSPNQDGLLEGGQNGGTSGGSATSIDPMLFVVVGIVAGLVALVSAWLLLRSKAGRNNKASSTPELPPMKPALPPLNSY